MTRRSSFFSVLFWEFLYPILYTPRIFASAVGRCHTETSVSYCNALTSGVSSDRRRANLLLHGSSDVGEVVRSKIQEGLHLQFGHLLQYEAVVWQDMDIELERQHSVWSQVFIVTIRHRLFRAV